jgi:hypothetical protein
VVFPLNERVSSRSFRGPSVQALPTTPERKRPRDTRIVRRRLLTLRGILLANPTSCKRQLVLDAGDQPPSSARSSSTQNRISSTALLLGAIGSWTAITPYSATPKLIRHYERASHDGSLRIAQILLPTRRRRRRAKTADAPAIRMRLTRVRGLKSSYEAGSTGQID